MTRYLVRYVGHLAGAGEAEFDAEQRRWHVPVLLRTGTGAARVGEFELDEALDFVRIPTKEDMLVQLQPGKQPLVVREVIQVRTLAPTPGRRARGSSVGARKASGRQRSAAAQRKTVRAILQHAGVIRP